MALTAGGWMGGGTAGLMDGAADGGLEGRGGGGCGNAPASHHLYDAAVQQARAEFEPRRPNAWAGEEGTRDLVRMSRVAFLEIPALTDRFEARIDEFVDRIHAIDGPTARVVRAEALLAHTFGLRIVRGGIAA